MEIHKKTKIIATIGPASDSKEKIAELIEAGVNIFRFNMKHATIDWHRVRLKRVKQVAKTLDAPVATLVDLQGPEIRLETKGQQELQVTKGCEVVVNLSLTGKALISIPHKEFFSTLHIGDFFLIDDGSLEFIVVAKKKTSLVAQAMNDGVIKHRKGINIPGKDINLPSLIKDDLKKLNMAAKAPVDFIALSFSRSKKDIDTLKKELNKRKIKGRIVAKIESRQAINNLDELINSADAVMIARGDLGIEIPIEELAFRQKNIVKKCRLAKKPVIIATQMLQSMIRSPRPTRAEATDVANAVYDGADAVMLSEETSAGKFPVKAVQAMTRILKYNENKTAGRKFVSEPESLRQLIVNAAVSIANDKFQSDITAIATFTESGYTARILSSFHTKLPVFAITDRKETANALIMSYGVTPVYTSSSITIKQPTQPAIDILKKLGVIKPGHNLMFVHGAHRKAKDRITSIALKKIK